MRSAVPAVNLKMAEIYTACREENLTQLQEILDNGYDVDSVNNSGQTPLMCAAINGKVSVVRFLVQEAHANVHIKSPILCGQSALHLACENGNIAVARLLIDLGAYIDGKDDSKRSPILVAADWRKFDVICDLIDMGADYRGLKGDVGRTLLLSAIEKDHPTMISMLLNRELGTTELQERQRFDLFIKSAKKGYHEVIKYFVLGGPGAFLDRRDAQGCTAFYYAARNNHVQCGVLLAEGGVSLAMTVVHPSKLSPCLPLDIATPEFKDAILQSMQFHSKKTICVIGNEKSGKSTLIASLQNENASIPTKVLHWFFGVKKISERTTGIEPVPLSSKRYGHVILFDFAGQHQYHGPHEKFLESLVSNSSSLSTVTVIAVVKATDKEADISEQLARWLYPMSKAPSTENPIQVILVASFWDKVSSKVDAKVKLQRCYLQAQGSVAPASMTFKDVCTLDCRQPYASDISKLCSFLNEIPPPMYKAADSPYSICWVISLMNRTIQSKAIDVANLKEWIIENKINLPTNLPPVHEVCKDLSATGHFLYLPNKNVGKGWLLLDLPAILHEVYGTLFSSHESNGESTNHVAGNEFGLVSEQKLGTLFPNLSKSMVRDVLVTLDFCIDVDSLTMRKLKASDKFQEDHDHLFFPALVLSNRPDIFTRPESVRTLVCQLVVESKQFLSPHVLQTIILRLAADHPFLYKHGREAREQYWTVWRDGIFWQSDEDVDVAVQMSDNTVIQVIGRSHSGDALSSYVSHITSDIFSTIHKLSPSVFGATYIVHPPDVQQLLNNPKSPPLTDTYPVDTLLDSVTKGRDTCLARKNPSGRCEANRVQITELFSGLKPHEIVVKRLCFKNFKAARDEPPESPDPLHGVPTLSQLDQYVIPDIAYDWERIGLHLSIKDSVLKIVEADNPHSVEKCCRAMFSRWLSCDTGTGEEPRQWRAVLIALKNAGYRTLVGEVEKTLFDNHHSH